jgi:hypothetical protein
MAYGTVQTNNLVYSTSSGDITVAVSGIALQGAAVISGVSGIFTTSVSGATVTGNAGQFGTITGNTAQVTTITAVTGIFTTSVSGATVAGTTITGTSGQFTTVTSQSGIFTTQLSGATITGGVGSFGTVSGGLGFFSDTLSVPSGSATSPSISINGDPNTGLFSPGADQVAISTNGVQRVLFDAAGNITLSADADNTGAASAINFNIDGVEACDINNAGNLRFNKTNFTGGGVCTQQLDSVLNLGGGANTLNSGLNLALSGPDRVSDVGYLMRWNTTALYQWNKTIDVHTWNTGGSERMRLDSSGRLGLGTSSPAYPLTVSNNSATFDRVLQLTSANTDTLIGFGTSGGSGELAPEIGASGTGLQFNTQNTPRMTIAAGGNVGIGTTSPDTAIHVNSGTIDQAAHFESSDSNVRIKLKDGDATNAVFVAGKGDNLAFETAGNNERARIDSSGRLLVGTSTARTNFYNGANTAQIQLEGTNYQNAAFAIVCNANSDDKGSLILAKNRGATVGSNTVVQDGDDLGSIEFLGSDGTEFVQAADIKAEVDGTPGANDMPGRLVFSTTADGASSPTERMRINSAGNIITTGTFVDPAITGTILEDVFTITDGAAFEVDPGNGSIQLITLGASRTPKATNFAAGESITLMVDDGTAYTLTWTDATWGGSGVVWAGGSAPTLATSGYTVLQFWKVSTQVYGALVGSVA